MAHLTNPSEIARETLRLLASRRIPPTPDSYRQHYLEISGTREKDDKIAAPVWAQLILDLLKQWEARHSGVTTAKKRESLERVLASPGYDAAKLATKLRKLLTTWSSRTATAGEEASAREIPDTNRTGNWRDIHAVSLPPKIAPAPTLLPELRELLAQTLEFAIATHFHNASDLAEEAAQLARQARAADSKEAVEALAAAMRKFWYRLEQRGSENQELHQGLLRLLRLLIDNTHELLSEDQWMSGQVGMLQAIVARDLDKTMLIEAERQLKEVIFKQGTLRNSLQEAKAALKQLISSFIDRLGALSVSAGDFHDRLESYAQRINQTDDINQLNCVIGDLLTDTRAAQIDAARTRAELLAARQKVEEAEAKVQSLERELVQVSGLVHEDQLTGVLNRRGLDDAYQREISRADRTGSPLCVGLLDVDNFKALNDAYGHQTGDDALRHLVRVTKRTMRPSDVLARYGGEEFMLLLPETTAADAVDVMMRLQRNLTKAFFLHNNERLLITFSAGVAQRHPGENESSVIGRADNALYCAKRSGKNRVCSA